IRGLGGYVCRDNDDEKCPVCQLFGMTSHARRFRLQVEDFDSKPLGFYTSKDVYNANAFWLWRTYGGDDTGGKRIRDRVETKYQFGVNCIFGDKVVLSISSFYDDAEETISILAYLLSFLSHYAGIGAKLQNGFGLFRLQKDADIERLIKLGKENILKKAENSKSIRSKSDKNSLDLRYFFSNKIHLANFQKFNSKLLPVGEPPRDDHIACAFDLRYKYRFQERPAGLRDFIKMKSNRTVANELLGQSRARTDDERAASKIFVGHPYKEQGNNWFLKVYGYVPNEPIFTINLQTVKEWIKEFYTTQSGPFPGSKIIERFDIDKEFAHA
ncbi:MAG: RAMP superfamily CRISPR-associated protein, partial [bacterium]|nr:RAMP superfamily CRISPR-associated protein [bacterium]